MRRPLQATKPMDGLTRLIVCLQYRDWERWRSWWRNELYRRNLERCKRKRDR